MRDLAEERFAWLLNQRGVSYVDEAHLEQKVEDRGTRPDFYAWTPHVCFLAEVEALHKEGPFRRWLGVGFGDVDAIIRRLRTPVQHAAKQLAPYRDLEVPMLVILDNHRKVGIQTGPIELIQLLGTLKIRVPIDTTTGRVGNARWHHGGGRTLSPDWRTYISGVAVNLPKRDHVYNEPPEKQRPMRVRLLHNPYADVPFPVAIFSDSEDEHYGRRNGEWVNLVTGERVVGG